MALPNAQLHMYRLVGARMDKRNTAAKGTRIEHTDTRLYFGSVQILCMLPMIAIGVVAN